MPINISRPRTAHVAPAVTKPSTLPDELLTMRQAMEIAQVADATIRRWIRRKELRAYKLGGQVRIARDDLLKLLQPWSPRSSCEYPK
jgi:excisionase family DNA binding protein